MSSPPDNSSSGGPRQHLVEVGVAAVMALLGIITIIGSLQVGIGWGAEGPKSGFFPFWIGLIIVATSLYNLVRAYAPAAAASCSASWARAHPGPQGGGRRSPSTSWR